MSVIDNLKALLEDGQDNALLRFSLGNAYLNLKDYPSAIEHLAQAVKYDPDYSAAWKLYGKALTENHQITDAVAAYEKGIAVAEKNGDIQAVKEMRVFRKRLDDK